MIGNSYQQKALNGLKRLGKAPFRELVRLPVKIKHLAQYALLARQHRRIVDNIPALNTVPPEIRNIIGNAHRGLYLAQSLSVGDRLACLETHYHQLGNAFRPNYLTQLLAGVTLWEYTAGDTHYSISLRIPADLTRPEGDLAIALNASGQRVYSMNFSLVPLQLIETSEKCAVLIGRIQGKKGMDLIKQTTRELAHVPPQYLLLSAIRGIAEFFAVDRIIGVDNGNQIIQDKTAFYFDYDKFWESVSATHVGRFHILPIPFPEKDLSEVSSRSRTQKKRAFRATVQSDVGQRLKETFGKF